MRQGTILDLRLRLRGLPVRWRAEITAFEPPERFVDEQLRGPYRLRSHEHRLEEAEGATPARDRLTHAVSGARLLDDLFVRRDVERICACHPERLHALFG